MSEGLAPPPRLAVRQVAGVDLVLVEEHSLPWVQLLVVVKGGTAGDPTGQAGRTRLMMELLLRGTTQKSRVDFHQQVERLGTQLDVSTGALLSQVRAICLRQHFEATSALVGEALTQPLLSAGELAALQDEAMAGLLAERDDDATVAEIFLRRVLYGDHPLARWPLGEAADLVGLTPAVVEAAHSQRITRANLLIGLAGDVTLAEAESACASWLANVPAGTVASPPFSPVKSVGPARVWVVDKPGRTQAQLRVARLATSGHASDVEPFWLGVVAFGGTFAAPFCQQIRDQRGWSYVADASFDPRALQRAPVVLRTAPALADLPDCLEMEQALFAGLSRGELATEPVAAARSYLVGRYPLEMATAEPVLVAAIRQHLLGRPLDEIATVPVRLSRLDTAQVRAAVRHHLASEGEPVVVVAPADEVVGPLTQRLGAGAVSIIDFRDGLEV